MNCTHRAERGFAEVNTSAFIADKLKKLGLNVQTGLAGTGLRASAGKEGGVNVALISELDGILCPSHPSGRTGRYEPCLRPPCPDDRYAGRRDCPDLPGGCRRAGRTGYIFAVPSEEFLSEDIRADSGRKISPPTQAERRS